MRTSATGQRISRPRHAIGGFTLIEILVVVMIIGIMAAGAVLSLGVVGEDRELDTERDRILSITGYLREQAALQNREYGMRCHDGGYEFLAYDVRSATWQKLSDDRLLRRRSLPPGLSLELVVEGRPVILPKADAADAAPQILLFSSGELSSFELTLRREDDTRTVVLAPDTAADAITEQPASPT